MDEMIITISAVVSIQVVANNIILGNWINVYIDNSDIKQKIIMLIIVIFFSLKFIVKPKVKWTLKLYQKG